MRPPGHSGKAKKGHLCFDAIYETGQDDFKNIKIFSNDNIFQETLEEWILSMIMNMICS